MRESPDDLHVAPDGTLAWRGRRYRVALGRAGVSGDKREGDGATPAGRFPLRRVWCRAGGAGCVALDRDDLLDVLGGVSPRTHLCVHLPTADRRLGLA
jgi:L,D-peptidoglycan transpeptidase YkuD (ErfK/YbiS/YcfS/YnhG family)